MHLPFLPLEFVTIHLEANTIGLNNVQRLDIFTRLVVFAPQVGQEVEPLCRHGNALPIRIRKCIFVDSLRARI